MRRFIKAKCCRCSTTFDLKRKLYDNLLSGQLFLKGKVIEIFVSGLCPQCFLKLYSKNFETKKLILILKEYYNIDEKKLVSILL